MAEPSEAARLRRLFEGMMGQALGNADLGEMRRVLREAGLPVDDPTQVAELERRWQELQPTMLQAAIDPEVDAFLLVDPVFQAAMERLGSRAADPRVLADEPAAIRAIVATRLIEARIDNGGWVSVFTETGQDMLPLAIDGYRLLGLDQHASLATRAQARGFEPVDDAFWEDLEGAWFDLPSPEAARAVYIGANPDIR